MDTPVISEIINKIKSLPVNLQKQVLVFVDTLQSPPIRGVPGQQLLVFAGSIPSEDLEQMRKAIEAGCEQVDTNEW